MLFVPCMSIKLLSTSWSNIMHMRIQCHAIRRRDSVAIATIIYRADDTTDQNTARLGLHPLMHTSLIFA